MMDDNDTGGAAGNLGCAYLYRDVGIDRDVDGPDGRTAAGMRAVARGMADGRGRSSFLARCNRIAPTVFECTSPDNR